MSATLLLASARVTIVISTVAALLAHAWLTAGLPRVPEASIAALLAGALGGWLWRRGTQAILLAAAHVWPLITYLVSGEFEPLAIMVWMTALTALTLVTTPLTRWSLPGRWQVPMAAWGMLLALGWPIMLARELDFTLITYLQNTTTQGVAAGPLRQTIAFVVNGSAIALGSILLLDWLWAHYGESRSARFVREVVAPLTIGSAIALGGAVYQGTVDLGWFNFGQWARLGRATGTLFDANALGAIAALWGATVAGAAMLAARREWRVLGLLLLSLATISVWASGSRTALLALLASLAGIAVALARAGRLSRLTSAIAVLTIVVTITVGWVVGGPGSALRRVWDTVPSPSLAGVSRFVTAMWVRDQYGAASIEMLREFPWTGVGPGVFSLMGSDYALKLSGRLIPPDNAQNWWRHQLTELGVVAGLIPIACSVLVLGATLGAVRRNRDPVGTVAAGAITGAGLISLVGSPAAHPLVLVALTVLIFWVQRQSHLAPQAPQAPQASKTVIVLLFVWLLPVAWAGATAWAAVTQLRPPFRAEALGWIYTYGISGHEELPGGAQRRWVSHRAVGVVPTAGSRLVLTLTAAPEVLAQGGPIGVRVFTRGRTLIDQTLGNDQSATTTIDLAGRQWTMVQIEASRTGIVVDGFERAVQLTSRVE